MLAAALDPVRYAAANASARGRIAQFLPADLWSAILAANDLDELVTLLGRSPYQTTLGVITAPGIAPEQVEQALWAYLVRSFRAPLKLVQGKPRNLLEWLWRRFEMDNLKTLLRTVAGGVPPNQIRDSLIPLGAVSELPWTALSEATSILEVVERLRSSYYGAFYARVLDSALDRYRREGQLFVLEVALDLAYFRRLLRLLDSLGGRDRREARHLIGTMVNSQNLLWAFRYRIYFNLSPEEILNYTLQRHLRADATVVRQIALGAPLWEVVKSIWGNRLPNLDRLVDLSPAEALPELELIFRRYLHTLALDKLRGYPFHLGTILAYEILLESEVRYLITVIEGKHAGWSTGRIRTHLIGPRG